MNGEEERAMSEPEIGRVRAAAVLDWVAGLLLAVLLYPFPVMRAALSLPAFVASILVSIVLIQVLLATVSLVVMGRSVGMHLFGLAFDEAPRPFRAVLWAFVWTIVVLPGLVSGRPLDPVRGWAAGAVGRPLRVVKRS